MRKKSGFGLLVVVALVSAVFAAGAQASISNIQVSVGATSITVTGLHVDEGDCHADVYVWDYDTGGDVYDQSETNMYGQFSATFENLVPGKRYWVEVRDHYCDGYVFLQVFTPGVSPPEPQGPDRYIYCAAAGNTDPAGNPLGAGQTLNLEFGQPATDKHYAGATLGFWVKDVGLTCQLTPAQAALAAASTTKVNHTGAANTQEGAQVYTFVG
jgi:hypothetical protein